MREWAAGQGLREDLNSSTVRAGAQKAPSQQRKYLEHQLQVRQEDKVWILSDLTFGGMTEFQGHRAGWIWS